MNTKIEYKLNPICEIIGLICMSNNYDKIIKLLKEDLDKDGINGELFFKKNLKILDRYIKTFDKYKVGNNEDLFF